MKNRLNRRGFIKGTTIAGGAAILGSNPIHAAVHERANSTNRLKIGLNAYTFNAPLSDGTMTIDDMLEFCAANGFYACDITAYYFPGYPKVCIDEFLYHTKHKAFSLGLEISGIGVRNDFAQPDPVKRKEHVALVKNWIEAAEKLGAPVIRVFAGNALDDESKRPEVLALMVKDMQECVAHGKAHGVVVAVQNHHDFLLTPQHTKDLIEGVNSEWFGLILDTGGYRSGDPYQQIAESIGYAVNWQIKEKIFVNGKEVDTDMKKLVHEIKHSKYRGYLPIETLGPGDPKAKAIKLFTALNDAMA